MKKVLNLILLTLFISSINTINVSAASNPYKQAGPYGTNCTWYAWKMANEKGGVTLPGWGNAKEWYNDAKNDGYSVGTKPASNSIIVWGNWTSYGHVGYVEKVEGDTLHVWDSTGPCIDEEDPTYVECMANGVSEESDRACKAAAPRIACKYSISESRYSITGYVYLNDVPKKTATTTTKKEEIKKSSNVNLSNIELNIAEIEFAKEVLEYNLKVDNNVDEVELTATTEDKKATVDGTGKYELNVGLNEIKLTVTAEDKSTKDYTIKITRKEKEVVIEKDAETTNIQAEKNITKKENKKSKIVLISSGCILILIITVLLVLRRKKYTK